MSRRTRSRIAITGALIVVGLASPALAQQSRARPGFTLTPRSGPVGTIVAYHGHLSTAQTRLLGHARTVIHLFIGSGTRPNGHRCVLGVDMLDDQQTVNDQTGAVSGHFRIGASGTCWHSLGSRDAVRPGRYLLVVGCSQCTAGRFRVTPATLPYTGSGPIWSLAIAGLTSVTAGSAICHGVRRRRA